ncbi:MAG TPA: choice-of-anchor X domain-containing protein, partial [Chitinophagaceae bacterium]|nr:choice-of-anchor X domain-containing protein [Chitinophagaceae bacterium]
MKSSEKRVILSTIAGLTIILLSWNHLDRPNQKRMLFTNGNKSLSGLNESEISAYTEDDDWFLPPDSNQAAPPAEDVLIQKIHGDNNHLLMMAFYSKENYSGQFVTIINNGERLVFRDDGQGDDKIAGDGLFTAKITADVNEFRKLAISRNQEMKKSNYKPIRFIERAMVVDPDVTDSFDTQALDKSETVSIANVTAVSSDLVDSVRTNSVFITALPVVEDPIRTWNPCSQKGNVNGAWTFKTLMKQLASRDPAHIATDAEVSDFVK